VDTDGKGTEARVVQERGRIMGARQWGGVKERAPEGKTGSTGSEHRRTKNSAMIDVLKVDPGRKQNLKEWQRVTRGQG